MSTPFHPLTNLVCESQCFVRRASAKRRDMALQDIVKYLMGILAASLLMLLVSSVASDGSVNESRQSRRLFDIFLGRFRPCITCTCGKSNRGGARFLGGEYTDTHEFPWLANIHVKNSVLVTGILINDRYVLTAASPLIGATPPEVKVALGEYDRCQLDISSVNASVDAIITHPEFNYEARAHDLSLIRLSRSTQFERRVLPVCLPDPGSTYLGQVGTLMGWTESSGSLSDGNPDTRTCRPRKLGLPILGRRECLKSGIKPENYHEESGCVGIIGSSSIVCHNDVGTSVLHRSYSGNYDLVGILSDINNCTDSTGTAIYTRVGPHIDWIYQNTKDACYCLKPFDVPEIKSLQFAY
ncbi:trypsin-1-like [Nasonia vitripennis]|uniref:Peptidase S1 domain-containing protein n=1 Tax=Nasonia vitripennis TaxID=7425 RepID=A0A7M7G7M2_NASVI|nr:trypsin-1-like [Nasonia vitripennis]